MQVFQEVSYSNLAPDVVPIYTITNPKTIFNFMRIFESFSTIVTMMNKVFFQLWKFMTFFIILCILFSLMLDVLGIGNVKIGKKIGTK